MIKRNEKYNQTKLKSQDTTKLPFENTNRLPDVKLNEMRP